jgi:hypothetical protein
MSIVLNNQKIETPGIETISWLDDPKVPKATDTNARTKWIRAIVLHTVKGKVGAVRPGVAPPSSRAERYAKYQANTSRDVSWDYTIDTDGTVIVSNDPMVRYTWHASAVNSWTIGIELVQEDNGDIWEGQVEGTVRFLDILTRELADRDQPIHRQIPMNNLGKPVRGVIPRIANAESAKSVVGVYGHRNQTSNRGPGDPGDPIFEALLKAGYKGFNYDSHDDITFWKGVQKMLGVTEDGVPGPGTSAALKARGYPHGLWVTRPGD